MTYEIDTDGMLDRCSCGERAGFHAVRGGWVASCSELCGEQTRVCGYLHEAMCAWNKARRAERHELHMQRIRARLNRAGMVLVWILTGAIWLVVAWLFVMWRRLEGEA